MLSPLAQSQSIPGGSDAFAARRKWLICLALAIAVAVAYAGVAHLGFVSCDDGDYISQNPAIQHGLNWSSLSWAFTTNRTGNWHPLTWFVLIIDYSLFGANPAGYHIANAVWHLANTVLLFLWLEYATGAFWRSAVVAAFFALHPFHVQSVAWAAERKDVLSTFFWMVSVWLYCAYSRHAATPNPRPARLFYAGSLGAFALGLMAKPMLVTLPCVLLLLDYWPLRRRATTNRLILEKIPFFAVAAAASILTVLAQKSANAVQSIAQYNMLLRLENAPVAYVRYLSKTFWPSDLCFYYPIVKAWPAGIIFGSIALLLAITVLVFKFRRRLPWLLVGWLWFIGMLVPTIGLVQVGEQSMADRYSYLPIVGIFIMVAWAVGDFALGRSWVAPLSAGLAAVSLLICSFRTIIEVQYWRNSASLFARAVDVGPKNYLAYYNLACYLVQLRDPTDAITYFQRCADSNPLFANAYNDLGFLQLDQGQLAPAISNLQKAVALQPEYPEAWMNLGRAYSTRGDAALAAKSFATVVQQKPDLVEARYRLGDLLLQQGAFTEAVANLQVAVSGQPRNAYYHLKLANARVGAGEPAKAVNDYKIALELNPNLAEACNNLAWILAASPDAALRDGPLAMEAARRAVELSAGKNPLLLGTFAAACAESGNFDQAIQAAAQARELALAQSNNLLAASLAAQINLYRVHQPFRDAHIK